MISAANPTVNPNTLAEGQEIVIPGLEGVTGILDTEIISFEKLPAQPKPPDPGLR